MTTADDNGRFPIHTALQNRARLGAIKLLFEGNPAAVQAKDSKGIYPIHIACQFCSLGVVKFLLEQLDDGCMEVCDNKDSLLHHACRSGNCAVVKFLLGSHAAAAASDKNGKGKVPLQLLCEYEYDEEETQEEKCKGGNDAERGEIEYAETIWMMLLATPDVVSSFA